MKSVATISNCTLKCSSSHLRRAWQYFWLLSRYLIVTEDLYIFERSFIIWINSLGFYTIQKEQIYQQLIKDFTQNCLEGKHWGIIRDSRLLYHECFRLSIRAINVTRVSNCLEIACGKKMVAKSLLLDGINNQNYGEKKKKSTLSLHSSSAVTQS